MASRTPLVALCAAASLGGLFALPALGQGNSSTVVITGRSVASGADVAGFASATPARLPLQTRSFGEQALGDAGARSIGALTALDASIGDAYNAEGYWSIVSVRGYTLDNRSNYRRDGLPINAETAIALDNKERVEVLKGISGMQAGVSAPGGLVNLVTKRADADLRSVRIEARQSGTVLGAVDLGWRVGPEGPNGRTGLRLNLAAERLDPRVRHTRGERWLAALAGDVQLAPDTLLQAEVEFSRQSQPSVAGFSMLGNAVPDARQLDSKLNLNDQPWRQPVVMAGSTASVRLHHKLGPDTSLTAQLMQQRLKSDDRTAFPFGVFDPDTYLCPQWCDRFAPDGSFTYWQYVSDNERRTTTALSLSLAGTATVAGLSQRFETGVLLSRFKGRFENQVFDIAGIGRIDGSLQTPPSAGFSDANTNRTESSTEWFARDAVAVAPGAQLWLGLRHTRLQRQSARTQPAADGLRATDYGQGASTPWIGLSQDLGTGTFVYASAGQGLESEVAPNQPRYANRGQALPALKSRQVEAGIRHESQIWDAGLAVFDIDRPQSVDIGACDGADTCVRAIDGSARHRGAEASAALRAGAWTWQASGMWLDARRRGAQALPAANGHRPVNVPKVSVRLGADLRLDAVPGLSMQARLAAEGDRVVLPDDDSVRIPGWSRIDLGARWRVEAAGQATVWRVGVDNVADRRAWKESPYQFGHVYLYPLAPRTWRASVQSSF